MKWLYIVAVAVAVIFSQCAPTRYVRPLEVGQHAINASFGGPTIKFSGAVIPVPMTTVGYGYGLDTGFTVYGNLHTTSLAFGTFQADAGACWSVWEKDTFGISMNFGLNMAIDRWEWNRKLWPQLGFNAYRYVGSRGGMLYAGADAWVEFAKQRSHEVEQPTKLLPAFHLGYRKQSEKWMFQYELKSIAPFTKNTPNVVDYVGLAGNGAFGLYFGIYRFF